MLYSNKANGETNNEAGSMNLTSIAFITLSNNDK